MFDRQSKGSKLGAIGGLIVVIAFFLPWVRACGTDVSGYAMATNSTGMIRDSWLYWIALLAGLACVGLFFLAYTDSPLPRIRAAIGRMVAGGLGFLAALAVWGYALTEKGMVTILFGLWIVTLGYVGIIVSFFMDIWSEE